MHWIALQPLPEQAQTNGGNTGQVELVDALTALAWRALQFTPKVARIEKALVLEVSASERLWGGRERLLRHVLELNRPVTTFKHAQGATSLVAVARLQGTQFADTEPDDLPLTALAMALPHLATLHRIGCTRWGQLRALPRAGVARRFGASLLDALDRAYGDKPELYRWVALPQVFEATLELAAQVEAAPAMLFGARRLLQQLQVWLQARHWGVLAIELNWKMDARRNTATQGQLLLRTAEPSADMSHLQRLLVEQLARITLPAPVLYLGLRSLQTQALPGSTVSLLPDEKQTGDSLHQLLERLSARLGSHQVLQLRNCADHRPEQMQAWQAVGDASQWDVAGSGITATSTQKYLKDGALYPTWLLSSPLKLILRQNRPWYQGCLTLLAGPQRIEAGWWGGGDCALRDYFLARSEQAGLLWIYRQRLAGQASQGDAGWYLHGFFA